LRGMLVSRTTVRGFSLPSGVKSAVKCHRGIIPLSRFSMCHHRSPIATVLSLSTARSPKAHDNDYYEILQISRKAYFDTIRRVFRIMAARFHPDNAETGDLETFLRMKRAYAVPLRSFEMQIRCGGVSKS